MHSDVASGRKVPSARDNSSDDALPLAVDRRPAAQRGGWLLVVLAGLGLLAAGAGYVWRNNWFLPAEPAPVVAAGPAEPVAAAFGLGRLVPASQVIEVGLPFGAGDARIATLLVREGGAVKQGDMIAVLDSEPLLAAAVDSARSDVAVKVAQLEQIRSSSGSGRDEAAAALSIAEANMKLATQEFSRTTSLFKRGVVAKSALDQKQAALSVAERDRERAAATLRRFDAADGESRPDVVVAERQVEAAKSNLQRVERELEKAHIRAPIDGTILSVRAQPGERPTGGVVASLADLTVMTAEIEVYETSIGRIALGLSASLTSDALPEALTGTVSHIGLEVLKQQVVDANPAANTDARVVKVTVTLDPASSLRARPLSNLQVVAQFAVPGGP